MFLSGSFQVDKLRRWSLLALPICPFYRHHQTAQFCRSSPKNNASISSAKEIGEEEVEQARNRLTRSLFQRLELPAHRHLSMCRASSAEDVRFTIEGMAKNLPADALLPCSRKPLAALSAPSPNPAGVDGGVRARRASG